MRKEIIIFGGGCFWCTEAIFKILKGVISVEPGYAGGDKGAEGPEQGEGQGGPTYEQVSTGTTGHAEVIKIEYDVSVIPLETLLTVFFASHDPTTKDRQGNDVGTQYRSIILYSTEEQKTISEKFIADLNNSSELGAPITTEVKLLETFYPAEDYHKNYYENNKNQSYCQVVINPKLAKVKNSFRSLMKEFSNENDKN